MHSSLKVHSSGNVSTRLQSVTVHCSLHGGTVIQIVN